MSPSTISVEPSCTSSVWFLLLELSEQNVHLAAAAPCICIAMAEALAGGVHVSGPSRG